MIRLKNIDTKVASGKGYSQTYLAYPIAGSTRCVFVAPVDCTVEAIDVYSVASAGCTTLVTYVGSLTTSLMTGATTSAIDGILQRNRLSPTGGNDLTAGNTVNFSISSTAANSAAHVIVTYVPLKHRGSR